MAGLIASATLEQIRAASDIVEVIGSYLPLKRAGANFVTLCPFHREKSPSFNVNPQRQIFHCFGCHQGGDVFSFIEQYENLTFVEAVRRLAERSKIALDYDREPGRREGLHLKETLWQIHEQITQRWQNALATDAAGQIARDYLRQRGVSEAAVKLFRLGFAPEAWEDTVNWAKSKGFELPLVERAGLILRREESDRYYDRFRGRLIFPICDEQGRVIAFSGRVLGGDQKTAKYVNSPETPIFTKGKVFFGLDKSKRAILDAGFAVVCEGQLDLIACYMAGTRNIVAPQGTAFTRDHARVLKRYVDEVVLCFDSDEPGQNAAARAFDSLLESGLAVRVAALPAPHDPDSYIRELGGPAFAQLIERAEGFFDFHLNRLCATNALATDKGRLAVVKSMAEAVLKTGSPLLADTYAQKTAQRLGVATESVRAEFKRTSRPKTFAAEAGPEEGAESPELSRPSEPEFWLVKFLLLSDDSVDWVSRHLDLRWLQHAAVKQIVAARLAAHADQSWRGVPALLSDCKDTAVRSLVTEAVAEDHPTENLAKKTRDTVRNLRTDYIDRELASLTRRLASPGLPDAELIEVERQKTQLRQLKQQPLPESV
jgi:DNA primase